MASRLQTGVGRRGAWVGWASWAGAFLFAFSLLPAQAAPIAFEKSSQEFALPSGKKLTAILMKPQSIAASPRLPLVFIFGGFENAGRVLELVHPKSPVLLATFDYPFDPPRELRFPASLRHLPEARQFIHETVEGIISLKQALTARSDVDPERLTIIGASFGAPFALAAAARDPGFRGVVVVHGFADVVGTASQRMRRSFEARFGRFGYPLAKGVASIAWAYVRGPVPERDARKLAAEQSVLVVNAANDTLIPRFSVDLLWSSIQGSQAKSEKLEMPGDHLQPGSDRLITEIMEHIQSWMERSGLSQKSKGPSENLCRTSMSLC